MGGAAAWTDEVFPARAGMSLNQPKPKGTS